MSAARICDKCSIVFSELEDGWQSFTATTVRQDDNGETITVRQAMDACPSCALIPPRRFKKELDAKNANDELGARIAQLERVAGVGQADAAPETVAGDVLAES